MLSIISEWCTSVNSRTQQLDPQRSNLTAISYNRVSENHQRIDGNLGNQTAFMARVCQRAGSHVVKTISVVESGRTLQRQGLESAISLARSTNSVVVAFSLLRLIRQRYPSENEVRVTDLAWLQDSPITFLTYVDPNATLSEIKSAEIKLGLSTRNPVDESLIAEIDRWKQLGMSVRNIADYLTLPKSTVYDLLKKCPKH